MRKNTLKYFIILLAALPAVLIGAIAMSRNDVPSLYYGLNIACLVVGWIASCLVLLKRKKANENMNTRYIIIASILVLYLLTFMNPGVEDVHRWISLGPIQMYISSIFTPLLIIELGRLRERQMEYLVGIITVIVAVLLALQPDASQLTAFAIPMVVILLVRRLKKIFSWGISGVLALLVASSWTYLDALPAVVYVEDILGLVMEMGLAWAILGVLALAMVPFTFLRVSTAKSKIVAVCLGIYYAVLISTTFFGNFPVPLMGYGISPILGYIIAMTWLIRGREE